MFNSAATIPAVGTCTYHHHDGLGSVIMLTNASGSVVERYRYDVFGQVTILDAAHAPRAATAHNNRFLYTGREWLAELDLYDYRNRTYCPTLGRFLQTDPIRFDAGDGNLYRYVGNEPVSLIDPLGLKSSSSSRGDKPQRGITGTQKIPPKHSQEGPGNFPEVINTVVHFINDTQEQRETYRGANTFGDIIAKCNDWKNSLPNPKCACCPTIILLQFTRPSTPPRKNIFGMNIPVSNPSGHANIIDYQMNFIEKKCSVVSNSDFPSGFVHSGIYRMERRIKL